MATARPEVDPERLRDEQPTAPPASKAPSLTYDPGRSGGGLSAVEGAGGVLGTIGSPSGFISGAVATVINAFTKENRPWRGRKLVADSETGKITALTSVPGRARNTEFGRTEDRSLELLQKTFDTGLVQSGIAPWYADFASALAAFRIELDNAEGPGAFVPGPNQGPRDPGESPPIPIPTDSGPDDRGGVVGDPIFNQPVDLRNLFMPVNPYMPFSGLPSPRRSGLVRRRRRASSAAPTRRKKKRSGRKGGRFVKGSAAAKRYMASLRRMRRK